MIGFRIVARNLKHDNISVLPIGSSASNIVLDWAAPREQRQVEHKEFKNDLLDIAIGGGGILLLILSAGYCADPTGNRIIGVIGIACYSQIFL